MMKSKFPQLRLLQHDELNRRMHVQSYPGMDDEILQRLTPAYEQGLLEKKKKRQKGGKTER